MLRALRRLSRLWSCDGMSRVRGMGRVRVMVRLADSLTDSLTH